MVPGSLEVVSVPRSGAEQAKKNESGFHAHDYTLSVYTCDILREEDVLGPVLLLGGAGAMIKTTGQSRFDRRHPTF